MRRPDLTVEQRRVWYLREAVKYYPDIEIGPTDHFLDLISRKKFNKKVTKWNRLIDEIKILEGDNIPEDNKKFIKDLGYAFRTFWRVARLEDPTKEFIEPKTLD